MLMNVAMEELLLIVGDCTAILISPRAQFGVAKGGVFLPDSTGSAGPP